MAARIRHPGRRASRAVPSAPRRPARSRRASSSTADATSFALLNKYPYSSGHLILAPYAHVGELELLGDETALELHHLGLQAIAGPALDSTAPAGFNLGCNLGRAPEPGIPEHVHLHVVPRWAGDTSFMPVLGDVKVMPEHLLDTRERLREAWPS